MSCGIYKPYGLTPEWLTESPITFDDLRCTSPPATLFRVSLPPSPVAERKSHRRDSVASDGSSDSDIVSICSQELKHLGITVDPPEEADVHAEEVCVTAERHSGLGQVWDGEREQDSHSFLVYDDDDKHDDAIPDENENEDDPSPIDPFFLQPLTTASSSPARTPTPTQIPPTKPPSPTHSRASSFDYASPWFMHFSADALAALDDQLLQTPLDAFADMCYAQAVDAADAPGGYSWRRFSRRPLTPSSELGGSEPSVYQLQERENSKVVLEVEAEAEAEASESESDADSDQLASPEQPPAQPPGWRSGVQVYSPTPADARLHASSYLRHLAQGSDGSIQFRPHVSLPFFILFAFHV